MQKKVEEVISILSSALAQHFDDFHGMYLHGAFVDGKKHKDEDIELVAIFDVENKYKREMIWPIVGKVETDLDVFIDLNPITMEELQKDEELFEEIIKYGIFFDEEGKRQGVGSSEA